MKRLSALDVVLLTTVVPLWIAAFSLHVRQVATGRLAWVGVFVTSPAAGEYPQVRGFWRGMAGERSGLEVGDRLTSVGGMDLRGAGPVGFAARAQAAAGVDLRVPVAFERDGALRQAVLQLDPARFPWRIAPFVAGLVIAGVAVLLRVPDLPIGRAFFLAAIAYAAQWTFFAGGPPLQTEAWAVFFFAASLVVFPLCLRVALLYPADAVPAGKRLPHWPWLFAVYGPVAFSWVFGTPLAPPLGQQAPMLLNVAFITTLLAVLTRNYRRSGPVGRRQLKWALLGLYVGLTPMLAVDTVAAFLPRWWWMHEVVAVFLLAIPAGLLVGIAWFNLFDVDRLITATAVYSILSFFVLAGLLILAPLAARASSVSLGVDPFVGQIVLSAFLAAAVFPARNAVRRPVERLLFAERFALRAGVDRLLREVVDGNSAADLIAEARVRLVALLRPERCDAYALGGPSAAPLFTPLEGAAAGVESISAAGPVARAIEGDGAPLDLQGGRRAGGGGAIDAARRRALEPLKASVVLPVLRGQSLVGFFVLGPKRSGDVYTETDLVFLGAVARHLSSEILRLEISSNFPRKVMDLLLRDPRELEPKARTVTILVCRWELDAEGVTRDAVQKLQDRCMAALEKVVDRRSGILLNRLGDTAVAIWNAPVASPDHAVRCCEAALELSDSAMLLETAEENGDAVRGRVRIGVHTGEATVGNFGTGQRVAYDARGECLRLATELESLNEIYGTSVLITDAARHEVGDQFVCRRLDLVRLAGSPEPVALQELMARRADDGDGRLRRLEDAFARALAAYRARDWAEAIERLESTAAEYPDDGPLRLYLERCRNLMTAPPPADWDGSTDAALLSAPDHEPVARQVFISHSSQDRKSAEHICRLLEERGITCWMAPRDVRPGRDFGEQLITAIEGAPVFVVILSANANHSVHVRNEVERACSKGRKVIPFRIEDVPPSRALEYYTSATHWIDAWHTSDEKAVESLLSAIRDGGDVAPA